MEYNGSIWAFCFEFKKSNMSQTTNVYAHFALFLFLVHLGGVFCCR